MMERVRLPMLFVGECGNSCWLGYSLELFLAREPCAVGLPVLQPTTGFEVGAQHVSVLTHTTI